VQEGDVVRLTWPPVPWLALCVSACTDGGAIRTEPRNSDGVQSNDSADDTDAPDWETTPDSGRERDSGPRTHDSADTATQASPPSGSWVKVAAGHLHTCALDRDGTVLCWGDNREGACDPPDSAMLDLASGWDSSCAIDGDGQLSCWGNANEIWDAPTADPFVSLECSPSNTCVAETFSGGIAWWGDLSLRDTDPPEGEFSYLGPGAGSVCLVDAMGAVSCYIEYGAADGTLLRLDPIASGATAAAQHGWDYGCALDNAGTPTCWEGDTIDEGYAWMPDGSYAEMSLGELYGCAVTSEAKIVCWGAEDSNSDEQPVRDESPAGSFVQVSVGTWHACAVNTLGGIECWGDDEWGQSSPPE
jgi:hypothetical protein